MYFIFLSTFDDHSHKCKAQRTPRGVYVNVCGETICKMFQKSSNLKEIDVVINRN